MVKILNFKFKYIKNKKYKGSNDSTNNSFIKYNNTLFI